MVFAIVYSSVSSLPLDLSVPGSFRIFDLLIATEKFMSVLFSSTSFLSDWATFFELSGDVKSAEGLHPGNSVLVLSATSIVTFSMLFRCDSRL